MTYLKGIVAGMVAALAVSVAYILAVFVLPVLLPFLVSRMTGAGGAATGYFSTGPVIALAAVAFAVGFLVQIRKVSARRARFR